MDRKGQLMGVSPSGGRYGRGRITGGGDLFLPPSEHSRTYYCDQAHYGPLSGGGEEAGVKGFQAVVGELRLGIGGDVDGGSVGGTDGGRGVDIQDQYRDGLNRWEDNVANVILGMEHNAPLAYTPLLELHHPIICTLGGNRGRLDRDR